MVPRRAIKVVADIPGDFDIVSFTTSVDYIANEPDQYDQTDPNYTKIINFHSELDSAVIVNYYNGFGQTLQTRSLVEFDDQEKVLVSGLSSKNSLGQIEKSYLPYIDNWNNTGLMNYEDSITYKTEVNNYYDGTNDIDLNGYTYSEVTYENTKDSRPIEKSSTGSEFSLSSGKILNLNYSDFSIVNNDTVRVYETIDQDGLKRKHRNHARGKYSKSISYYQKNNDEDSIVTTKSPDLLNQINQISIDTGDGDILLRKTYLNDRGLVDSIWKVDYGTAKMYYDKHGNLKFYQDSLLLTDNKCVYYKYDSQNRKIEEGTLNSASTFMNQTNANDRNFPESGFSGTVEYRWFYEYYYSTSVINPFDSSNPNEIINPGGLVRVESGDQTYFKNYISKLHEYWDATIIKLPLENSTEKVLRHYYNQDGTMRRFEIYPHFPDSSDARAYDYDYDISGRLTKVDEMPIDSLVVPTISRTHADYTYNINSVKNVMYGISTPNGPNPIITTVQKVDYTYDSRGMLVKINEPDLPSSSGGIETSLVGGYSSSNDFDHFGLKIKYFDASNGFYNGRIYETKSVNSEGSSTKTHYYQYAYNKLGWLTNATHLGDNTFSKEYYYNALGNRDSLYKPATSSYIKYLYDSTGHPGSSKLLRTSEMGSYSDIRYDASGNMDSDASRMFFNLTYDYRNMLTSSQIEGTEPGLPISILFFNYDENQMRIVKKYLYSYWGSCSLPDPPLEPLSGGSIELGGFETMGSGSSDQCPKLTSEKTLYLYDGNNLIATFDELDNVIDLFVNGKEGSIATYKENDDNKLYYYLKDHLGSVRVVMHDPIINQPVVVQSLNYYPFGEIIDSYSNIDNQFKFSGKELDSHTSFNFSYFGARYYDLKHARFTTLDKASEFVNGYSYVGNNPISLTDPDGNSVAGAIGVLKAAWGLYQFGKSAYSFGEGLVSFIKNPSATKFATLATSGAQGYVMYKVGNSVKGVGLKVGHNLFSTGKLGNRDDFINYGLLLANYGAIQYDKSRTPEWARIGFYEPSEEIYADWYETSSGDFAWYDTEVSFLGPVGSHKAEHLYDTYGLRIDPKEQNFIEKYSDIYENISSEIWNKAGKLNSDFDSYKNFWGSKRAGDLKNQYPFIENKYYNIMGNIYKSQDLGNMLYGAWANTQPHPFLIFQLGGGYAEANKFGYLNSLKNISTFGDDPRGAFFVRYGKFYNDTFGGYPKW